MDIWTALMKFFVIFTASVVFYHVTIHCMERSSINILLNAYFCVPWKKGSHTGLKQHECVSK